jgi:hypothetical protein
MQPSSTNEPRALNIFNFSLSLSQCYMDRFINRLVNRIEMGTYVKRYLDRSSNTTA